MKKIGVTGYRGRLGSYLTSHFPLFVPLDCDVTRPDSVKDSLLSVRPDAVLHLAAKSNVDWCENPENTKELSRVNLRGTFNVCSAADNLGMDVILMSSDHVFSGMWGKYKEKDVPNPANRYGLSKMAAEALQISFGNLKVIRSTYFFDYDRLAEQGDGEYPTFISRSFMHIHHFSLSLEKYFENIHKMPPILHIAGTKLCSWYELMTAFNNELGLGLKILPRKKEIHNLVPRPKKAGLNVSLSLKLGLPGYSYIDGIRKMK